MQFFSLYFDSTPFVEYEACGSAMNKTVFSKVQALSSGGTTSERRVDVQAVYRKIADYNGDLVFPQVPSEPFDSPRAVGVGPSFTATGNSAVAMMQSDSSAVAVVLASTASAGSNSVMSVLGSPSRVVVRKACPSTPQSASIVRNEPVNSLMSPLRSAPQRIVPSCSATPNVLLRGATTPGKSRLPTCATPAFSTVVVSQSTKEIIAGLLRPTPTKRITAAQLLDSEWLAELQD